MGNKQASHANECKPYEECLIEKKKLSEIQRLKDMVQLTLNRKFSNIELAQTHDTYK